MTRPFSKALRCLQDVGLRPTRQRLALAKLLFDKDDRHITAELLHHEVSETGAKVSLATIYNTLHQFVDAGLLKEVIINSNRTYFDTNTSDHHHIYMNEEDILQDISADDLIISSLPKAPDGKKISGVSVVVHMENMRD
ncbi:MAG: transcriptional repressor [Kordiimonadaceae bacterium]|mgnify:CR=1 FL=1|jgi:Fur family transcriptional regulator, iron response regulator|nr:transcriptional repressor [Kordiimonadaceae bacterium]MBT6035485.1 transcriptional repressor [Kordiimonadaceae bacterium]MBT6328914.1 transcriptional repressor [Kordiimonadaceae bacterium]MBT7583818.1 transcriptional repressor [Kordiimonadaceae bacterium]